MNPAFRRASDCGAVVLSLRRGQEQNAIGDIECLCHRLLERAALQQCKCFAAHAQRGRANTLQLLSGLPMMPNISSASGGGTAGIAAGFQIQFAADLQHGVADFFRLQTAAVEVRQQHRSRDPSRKPQRRAGAPLICVRQS